MPGCAAIGCSNSSKKGFVIKMRQDDWFPTGYSRLCEAHFAPDMWEITREDGSRKLKVHAVPTIFAFTIPRPKRKAPTKRELLFKRSAVSSISQAGNKPSMPQASTSQTKNQN